MRGCHIDLFVAVLDILPVPTAQWTCSKQGWLWMAKYIWYLDMSLDGVEGLVDSVMISCTSCAYPTM